MFGTFAKKINVIIMRRKTEEEKRFTGTIRAASKAKKSPVIPIDDGLRIPPVRLSTEAAELWLSEAVPLVDAEILTIADISMLCDMLELVVDYRRLKAEIGGQFIIEGAEGQPVRHPGTSVLRDMLNQINSMRQQYGFSPLSREKLPAKPKKQNEENPFAKFGGFDEFVANSRG